MKKLIAVLAFALIGVSTNAASLSPQPTPQAPIPSVIPMKRDQLISQNLPKVARVQVQMYAASILYSPTTNTGFIADYVHVGQAKKSEILALLGSQTLVYKLAKPTEDYVQLNAFYYDADWNLLFSGYAPSFKLEPDGLGWKTPQDAEKIHFDPVGEYYTIEGLYNAYFIERDENGNVLGYNYIEVYDGRFQFPWYLRDKRGELYLQIWNETAGATETIAYDSATGQQITPSTATTVASGSFNGLQSITPQGNLIEPVPIQSYQGFGESDLVEIEVLVAGLYKIRHTTTEGELPNTVIVWSVGDATESEIDRVAPAESVTVYLEPGVYHLRFNWPTLRSSNSGGYGWGDRG